MALSIPRGGIFEHFIERKRELFAAENHWL